MGLHGDCSLGSTMILVLILFFNILASSQAKPATNMNIKEARITMGENENGKGDYHHQRYNVNELDVNQGSIDYNHRGGRPAVVNRCGGFLGFVSILGVLVGVIDIFDIG